MSHAVAVEATTAPRPDHAAATLAALRRHRPELVAPYQAALPGARAAILGRLWGALTREPIAGLHVERPAGQAAYAELFAVPPQDLVVTLDGRPYDDPGSLLAALALPTPTVAAGRLVAELDNSVANLALARAAQPAPDGGPPALTACPPPGQPGPRRRRAAGRRRAPAAPRLPYPPGHVRRRGPPYAPEHRPVVDLVPAAVPPERWLTTGAGLPPLLPAPVAGTSGSASTGLRPSRAAGAAADVAADVRPAGRPPAPPQDRDRRPAHQRRADRVRGRRATVRRSPRSSPPHPGRHHRLASRPPAPCATTAAAPTAPRRRPRGAAAAARRARSRWPPWPRRAPPTDGRSPAVAGYPATRSRTSPTSAGLLVALRPRACTASWPGGARAEPAGHPPPRTPAPAVLPRRRRSGSHACTAKEHGPRCTGTWHEDPDEPATPSRPAAVGVASASRWRPGAGRPAPTPEALWRAALPDAPDRARRAGQGDHRHAPRRRPAAADAWLPDPAVTTTTHPTTRPRRSMRAARRRPDWSRWPRLRDGRPAPRHRHGRPTPARRAAPRGPRPALRDRSGPGTRHAFDRVEPDLSATSTRDVADLVTDPGLAAELTAPWSTSPSRTPARARPAPARDPDGHALDRERLAIDGHNLHPCGRTRLGWDVADSLRHDVEGGHTPGRVRRRPPPGPARLGDDLGATPTPACPRRRPATSCSPSTPGSATPSCAAGTPTLYRAGALRDLDGTLPAAPTAALRTLLLPPGRDGRRRYVKVALDVQVTSTRRTISTASTRNGPVLSAAPAPAARRRATGCCCSPRPRGRAAPPATGRDASAILRDGLGGILEPGETAVPGGALPVARRSSARSWPPTPAGRAAFLADYARLLLPPVVRWPPGTASASRRTCRTACRRSATAGRTGSSSATSPACGCTCPGSPPPGTGWPCGPGSVVGTDDVDVMRAKVGYTALQAHLGELVMRLGSHGLDETAPGGWCARCGRGVRRAAYDPSWAPPDARADHAFLTAPRVPHKALVRMRLAGSGDVYVPVHNPLHGR